MVKLRAMGVTLTCAVVAWQASKDPFIVVRSLIASIESCRDQILITNLGN